MVDEFTAESERASVRRPIDMTVDKIKHGNKAEATHRSDVVEGVSFCDLMGGLIIDAALKPN